MTRLCRMCGGPLLPRTALICTACRRALLGNRSPDLPPPGAGASNPIPAGQAQPTNTEET